MNMSQITTTDIVIAVVAIVALVVLALMINAFNRRRTQKLRAQFGPEYDRTVAVAGGRTAAEARLAERSERVHKLNIRSLNSVERDATSKSGVAFRPSLSTRPPEPLLKQTSCLAT